MTDRTQRGSTIPLIIGFTTILLLAGAVVIDASAAWLRRQSLDNLADGAALHAADRGAEGSEVYRGGLGSRLRLDAEVARRAVAEYLRAAEADFAGLSFTVAIDGARVRVTVRAPLDLPLSIPGGPTRPIVSGHGAATVAVDP
jgi:hypothetical protein